MSNQIDKPNMNPPSRIKTIAGDKPKNNIRLKKVRFGREARLQIKNALAKHDDLGTQSVSGTSEAVFKAPKRIKAVYKLGSAGIEVAKTGTLATITVANTIVFKGAQRVVIGSNHLSPKFLKRAERMKMIDSVPVKEASAKIAQGYLSRLSTGNVLYSQAMRTKLNETRISKKIIRGVKKVQHATTRIKTVVVSTGRITKRATVRTYNVVRGLSQGTITPAMLARSTALAARNLVSTAYYKGLPKVGETLQNVTVKSAAWTIKRGIPTAGKTSLNASIAITRRLASNDMAIQGTYNALVIAKYGGRTAHKTAQIGLATVKGTIKAVKTSVRIIKGTSTSIKTATHRNIATRGAKRTASSRPVWNSVRRARARVSAARTARRTTRRAGGALARAGFSITNLALSAITKIAAPLILGGILVVILFQLISVPIQAIGAIFGRSSSVVDDDGQEIDEIDLLEFASDTDLGVPAFRQTWLSEMATSINEALSSNDVVRLFTDLGQTSFTSEVSIANLENFFMNDEQWTYMVFPIFSTFMLTNHELSGTIAQHQAVLASVFLATMRVESEEIREFCDQSFGWLGLGEGRHYFLPHYCGHTWTIYHSASCEGHLFWDDDIDDYDYYYCNEHYEGWEEHFECEGCSPYCADNQDSPCSMRDIHNILAEFVGLYRLARILIIDPLEALLAIDISIFDDLDDEDREEVISAIEYAISQYETALEVFIATLEVLEEELEIDLIPPELMHLVG